MRKQITEIPHIILSRHTSDNKKQRNNEIKNQKQEKTMKKTRKHLIQILAVPLIAAMITGCRAKTENPPGQAPPTQNTPVQNTSGQETSAPQVQESGQSVEIQVFIAASLKTVMTDLAQQYQKDHPHIKITFNADSSGTLLTQIQEGYECDIFFSAAPKQMNQLEESGLMVQGSRANVVNNQVVVITWKGSNTKVTGLQNLEQAESIALAGGTVPVGRYTRQALIQLGRLQPADDAAQITTQQISQALGGVEISEQSNVSKVLLAVTEGSCQVGTTYYSDIYGYEDKIEILETVSPQLSGDVIYPIAQVKNPEADEAQTRAAKEFLEYILSQEAKTIFQSYYFDTDV